MRRLFAISVCIAVLAASSAAPAQIFPTADQPDWRSDDMPGPLGQQRRALRARLLEAQVLGTLPTGPGPYGLPPGQFVELERAGEDRIWTILAEFGDQVSPYYGGAPGPQHNQIPEPDRSRDNMTTWLPDYNRDHYVDLLFGEGPGVVSLRTFYIEQSSGRYAVDGDVTDWVEVPYNAAHYGSNDEPDECWVENRCGIWLFIEDALDAWYASRIEAGWTPQDIDAYLSRFDVRDRSDGDRDGNFDEPDGYIDHFQIIHAGVGEEAGGGALLEDAIWSHRGYAHWDIAGVAGPSEGYRFGGIQIGDSAYWIGDYTTEPENGGLGIFAHEFGHDLGLPHPEPQESYWSVMGRGSWLGDGGDDVGARPGHLNALEKLQLGWLDYEVASAGEASEHRLGPSMTTTRQAQALMVVLPDKPVPPELGPPYSGEGAYWSGTGNERWAWMVRPVTLPAGASLSAKVRYEMEEGFDYAYLVASDDGTWFWTLPTSLSSDDDPNGLNLGFGITGSSEGEWVDLTGDLSGYEGNVWIAFIAATDDEVSLDGFFIDDIALTGNPLDDAESDFGWSFSDGFTWLRPFFNAYVAEYRQYRGYDETLETGPYVTPVFDPTTGDFWAVHFPYQAGLIVTYWDMSQPYDNPAPEDGRARMLPVDAHPDPIAIGSFLMPWSVQAYDVPFGLEPTDPWLVPTLFGLPAYPSQPAAPVFDDNLDYWREESPWSARHPHTGTWIGIQSVSETGFMQVRVGRSD